MDDRERARKAYDRLRMMADASGPNEQARLAARTSEWAPTDGKLWKDIHRIVTTEMVKEAWPSVSDEQIRKGRLKLDRCIIPEIRENAEAIYLTISGTTLFHTDCPLWFAKMLYMHFVLKQPVDFSSREPNKTVADIRTSTVTVSREELRYALAGAAMQTHDQVEELQTQLRTASVGAGTSNAPNEDIELKRDIKLLRRELREMEARAAPQPIMTLIEHPNTFQPPPIQSATSIGPCPVCGHFFHNWSGHYQISCGHMYHLTCLMQSMLNRASCQICAVPISKFVYGMFKMEKDYERLENVMAAERDSVIASLNLSL